MGIGRRKHFVGDETCRVGEKLQRAGRNDPYQPISDLGLPPSDKTLSETKGIPLIHHNIKHALPPTESTAEASQTRTKRKKGETEKLTHDNDSNRSDRSWAAHANRPLGSLIESL